MGVYDIVTPDNLSRPPIWRRLDFDAIVPHNTLFFWTGNHQDELYGEDGIKIDLSGQVVKQIDEDSWLLQPSNIEIRIDFQTVKLKSPSMNISQAIMVGEGGGEDEADAIVDELRHFLDRFIVKQAGRSAGLVNRLEMPMELNRAPGNNKSKTLRRNIPYGAKSVISSFLTGKTGSLQAQTNKLQQNLGVAMAPRPRRRRRHTRRRV